MNVAPMYFLSGDFPPFTVETCTVTAVVVLPSRKEQRNSDFGQVMFYQTKAVLGA